MGSKQNLKLDILSIVGLTTLVLLGIFTVYFSITIKGSGETSSIAASILYAVLLFSFFISVVDNPISGAHGIYLQRATIAFYCAIIFVGALSVTFLVIQLNYWQAQNGVFNGLLFLLLNIALCTMAHLVTESHKKSLVLNKQAKQYKADTLLIAEYTKNQERQRMGSDIHDSIGNSLVVLHLLIDQAISQPLLPEKDAKLLEVKKLASGLKLQVRKLINDAYATLTEPLQSHLMNIVSPLSETVFNINIMYEPDSGELKDAILNICKESISNILKHSEAKFASIVLQKNEGFLTLEIIDNGIGANQLKKGIGLLGIERRVSSAGGTVLINYTDGFKLTLNFPHE